MIQDFREKLQSGTKMIGASITFNDPLVSEALADSVDFLWIDMEHTGMNFTTLGLHLLACRSKSLPALVRVPDSSTANIKAALDIGAEGLIIPQVRSKREVESVIRDARYPPRGARGFGPRVPSNYGRRDVQTLLSLGSQVFIAVQIETEEAFSMVDEIASIAGLDSLVIGPFDLSGAVDRLGNVKSPGMAAAMERIIGSAAANNLFVGMGMGIDFGFAKQMMEKGIHWLQIGCDFDYLRGFAETMRAQVRERI